MKFSRKSFYFSRSVQFYGCKPFGNNVTCCTDTTVDATDPTMYRHVSVDTDKVSSLKTVFPFVNDVTGGEK
jgi:hypothetical protein